MPMERIEAKRRVVGLLQDKGPKDWGICGDQSDIGVSIENLGPFTVALQSSYGLSGMIGSHPMELPFFSLVSGAAEPLF